MTLEEAQARIIELEEENTGLRNECDTLSQNNTDLTTELGQVKALNQKYFNKLSAQYSGQGSENNDDEKEVPTCEEFATTLKGKF